MPSQARNGKNEQASLQLTADVASSKLVVKPVEFKAMFFHRCVIVASCHGASVLFHAVTPGHVKSRSNRSDNHLRTCQGPLRAQRLVARCVVLSLHLSALTPMTQVSSLIWEFDPFHRCIMKTAPFRWVDPRGVHKHSGKQHVDSLAQQLAYGLPALWWPGRKSEQPANEWRPPLQSNCATTPWLITYLLCQAFLKSPVDTKARAFQMLDFLVAVSAQADVAFQTRWGSGRMVGTHLSLPESVISTMQPFLLRIWHGQAELLGSHLQDPTTSVAAFLWSAAFLAKCPPSQRWRSHFSQLCVEIANSCISTLSARLELWAVKAPYASLQAMVNTVERGEKKARRINFLTRWLVNQKVIPRINTEEQDAIKGSTSFLSIQEGNGHYLAPWLY